MTWHRAGHGNASDAFSSDLSLLIESRAEARQVSCFSLTAFSPLSSPAAPCKEFAVTMRPTEASERCRLRGSYTLRTGKNALELWGGPELRSPLYIWPYRFLRRFGRDKVSRGCRGWVERKGERWEKRERLPGRAQGPREEGGTQGGRKGDKRLREEMGGEPEERE